MISVTVSIECAILKIMQIECQLVDRKRKGNQSKKKKNNDGLNDYQL